MLKVVWSRKSRPALLRILFYGLLFQILIMVFLYKGTSEPAKPEESVFFYRDNSNNYMNVCALPVYDYWHPMVMRHVDYSYDPTSNCDRSFKPYTELVNGIWSIVEERQDMNCSARCFEGRNDWKVNIGEWMKPGRVDCEFLEAVCWDYGIEVYGYIHTQIKKAPPVVPKPDDPPSVFVFLFDSTSSGLAKRSLPKTVSLHTNRLGAVDFPFINKVGENSLPNGLVLWFGKAVEGFNDELFGGRVIEAGWNSTEYCRTQLKNESIFKDFSDLGYTTLDIDDWAAQMVNYPNCEGFSQKPTNHYMHPFQLMYERSGTEITKQHLKGKLLCREEHHAALEYFQQFLDAYEGRPKFTWMWLNSLAHDRFNGLMRVDNVMVDLFEKNMELFDNSFVIIMGDHGYRLGKRRFLQSEIGKLEINNPYFSMSIPKKLRKNRSILETMRENSRKLQTHFDTRATLLDIAKFQPQSDFKNRSFLEIPKEKGHSYLRTQPSFPRTCGSLPIPHQYCICQMEKVPINDENLKERLGKRLIDHVHSQLESANFSSMCEKFELREVTSLLHYGHTNHSESSHNYEIVVMATAPSFAQFHTTIAENKTTSEITFGNFLRLDQYGDTGDCTNDRDFEKLCYCKKLTIAEKLKHWIWSQLQELAYTLENMVPSFLSR